MQGKPASEKKKQQAGQGERVGALTCKQNY